MGQLKVSTHSHTQLQTQLMMLYFITSSVLALVCVHLCSGIVCGNSFGYKFTFRVCIDSEHCSECDLEYTHCLAYDRTGTNKTCSICMKDDELYNIEHYELRNVTRCQRTVLRRSSWRERNFGDV